MKDIKKKKKKKKKKKNIFIFSSKVAGASVRVGGQMRRAPACFDTPALTATLAAIFMFPGRFVLECFNPGWFFRGALNANLSSKLAMPSDLGEKLHWIW